MRPLVLVLAFLLAGCGGRQSEKAGQPNSDVDEDIELPWKKANATTSHAPPPIVAPRRMSMPSAKSAGRSGPGGDALLDFEVKDTDLHDAFRLVAHAANIDIVVADSVVGRVSMRVRQVTWRQLLDTLVNLKKLTLSEQDGIYYVQ